MQNKEDQSVQTETFNQRDQTVQAEIYNQRMYYLFKQLI